MSKLLRCAFGVYGSNDQVISRSQCGPAPYVRTAFVQNAVSGSVTVRIAQTNPKSQRATTARGVDDLTANVWFVVLALCV